MTFHISITTLYERHLVFVVVISDVTSKIYNSDVIFNILYEMSQPMGKTEFSSTGKIEPTLSHR